MAKGKKKEKDGKKGNKAAENPSELVANKEVGILLA